MFFISQTWKNVKKCQTHDVERKPSAFVLRCRKNTHINSNKIMRVNIWRKFLFDFVLWFVEISPHFQINCCFNWQIILHQIKVDWYMIRQSNFASPYYLQSRLNLSPRLLNILSKFNHRKINLSVTETTIRLDA